MVGGPRAKLSGTVVMVKAFNIYIGKYDWGVRVYLGDPHSYADEALRLMRSIGCRRKDLRGAMDILYNNKCNEGITYSNNDERMSVMVIEATDSPAEFLNSLVHECGHLATHIALSEGIDLRGEEVQYISGEFARSMYPWVRELLCCGCHQ